MPIVDGKDTAICCDVIEHVPIGKIRAILRNLQRAKKQVITVHVGPSSAEKVNLHITRLSKSTWDVIMSQYFDIVSQADPNKHLRIYMTKQKVK